LGSVAPTVRSFSADLEPLGLVGRFAEFYPGLLESSAPVDAAHGGNRFDILPISSGETLRMDAARRLSGPGAAGEKSFLNALENWWAGLRTATPAPLPFGGGWLVYLGYELASEIEPRLKLPPGADPVIALAIRTPAAWVRDRFTQRAWLIAEPGCEALLDRFTEHAAETEHAAMLDHAGISGDSAPGSMRVHTIEEEEPAQFLEAVRRSLEYIAAGDVYQANLSRLWQGRSQGPLDPVSIYRRLRATNPSPFAAILRDGDFALMSSSPERLMSIQGNRVCTRPIAGTRPRGATAADDARIIRSLLDNEKERAEHVMLIDLERNDLGRVCVGGSVQVDEYMVVETYAHVHHIVSNVSGRLRDGVSPIQVIRSLFPGGTITGCPKVRCMEIIAELEAAGRGAYTGSVGYLNRDGSCDLNILIRTISAHADAFRFRAGAGIVADSNPEQELAETRAKAKGLLRALEDPR
jgi:anthranilate synthase component I